MSGEPTDLIREATAALDGITPAPWEALDGEGDDHDVPVMTPNGYICLSPDDGVRGGFERADAVFIAAAPDLVRRLRDALEASEAIRKRRGRALVAAARERDALVEAIERDAARIRDRGARG